MANKPTPGRVGVAPSRERCQELRLSVQEEMLCAACCTELVGALADQDAAIEREVLGDRAGQPAVAGPETNTQAALRILSAGLQAVVERRMS